MYSFYRLRGNIIDDSYLLVYDDYTFNWSSSCQTIFTEHLVTTILLAFINFYLRLGVIGNKIMMGRV